MVVASVVAKFVSGCALDLFLYTNLPSPRIGNERLSRMRQNRLGMKRINQ